LDRKNLHLTIGALLLVKWGVDAGAGHPAYWALTGLYVLERRCSALSRSSAQASGNTDAV
jgi:hypothetical protein